MSQCVQQRRWVIITGGTRGIGFATAKVLAEKGFALELWYRSRQVGAEVALQALRALGATIHLRQVDVSQRSAVQQALVMLEAESKTIQTLINNAGILQQKPFATISDQDWDQMMAVNLKSVFICAQEIMPKMSCKGASIVNIASSGGQLGGTLGVHYAASKAAVIALTKSLARVGVAVGVRVNCVAPGLIETEMTAQEIASEAGQAKISKQIVLARPGSVDDVAAAVAFLASDQAAYMTGQTLNVNGGLYMA
ncbi:MAG: SDR family oxidoreductase [Gammaproteobacteria bacterium]|nr:SDR family oxidoreductase [Gammaproteobacteria bacterium]